MLLVGFPLLLIPFAIYNIIIFLMPGVDLAQPQPLFTVNMLSGAQWNVSAADLLNLLAILLLFGEIIKATRFGSRAILDHMLSLLLFVIMLVEFIMVRGAATSTFFTLMIISFVDVIAGFSVSIRAAQRDIAVDSVDRLQQT